MGLPLSRFNNLYDICRENAESHQDNYYFKNTKLVGIILNDPDDWRFKDQIEREFNYLDQATTENFLFMTFIDNLPGAWQERHDFHAPHSPDKKACQDKFCFENGYEKRDLIFKLKSQLHIKENLPVLLLTNNLMGNEFDVLKTSESDIEFQLFQIGRFCCNYDGEKVDTNSDAYQRLIKNWGIPRRVTISQRLADTLRDILAPYAMKIYEKEDPYVADMAKKHAFSVLNQLSELMDKLEQDHSHEESDTSAENEWIQRIIAYNDYFVSIIKNCDKPKPDFSRSNSSSDTSLPCMTQGMIVPPNESIYHIPEWKISQAEEDSRDCIDSFNTICGSLFNNLAQDHDALKGVPQRRLRDYKGLILYLCSFFEIEIDRSIVQLMRKCIGISMPDNYYQLCKAPGNYNLDIGANGRTRTLYLNKRKGNDEIEWPALGDSIYGWRKMMNNIDKYPDIVSCGDRVWFDRNWFNILTIRNNISHFRPSSEEDLIACHRTLNNILDYHFQDMVRLKQSLSQ